METMTVTKDAIELIQERIELMGIKQNHIAKQIECSEIHLSGVLNRKRNLTQDLKNKLFSYLQIAS